jgi:hypothetical protein
MKLTKNNFLLYAAKHYHNPTCIDEEEFFEDLNRFKYLKRLMNKYKQSGEISERLVLNHLIVILNVFGNEAGIEMLANRIELEHWNALKPFLIFLRAIKYDEITGIEMDKYVISKLRELKWES